MSYAVTEDMSISPATEGGVFAAVIDCFLISQRIPEIRSRIEICILIHRKTEHSIHKQSYKSTLAGCCMQGD